jgi:hypothetical protein
MTSQTGGNQIEYDAKQAAAAYATDMANLDTIEAALSTPQTGYDEKLRQAILAMVAIHRHLLKASRYTVKKAGE